MSTIAIDTDFTNMLTDKSPGFSSTNEKLSKYISNISAKFKSAESIGGSYKTTINELKSVYKECKADNWDGYNAVAISEDTYNEAEKFIDMLPLFSFKMPSVTAEPDGGIALEWYKDSRHLFVISFYGRNEIVYAGLFGGSKTHGVEYFNEQLPKAIVTNIRRIF